MTTDPPWIETVNHRDAAVAQALHEVWRLAQAQEAALLPPAPADAPTRTPAEWQASGDVHLAAFVQDRLVGVLSLGPDDEPGQILVTLLAVRPSHQRQGVGRALLLDAIGRAGTTALAVSTTAANLRALRLYRRLGFVDYRRGSLGAHAIAVVKLRRAGGAPAADPGAPA